MKTSKTKIPNNVRILMIADHDFVLKRAKFGSAYDLELLMYLNKNIENFTLIYINQIQEYFSIPFSENNLPPDIIYVYVSSEPHNIIINGGRTPFILYTDDSFYVEKISPYLKDYRGMLLSVKMERLKQDYINKKILNHDKILYRDVLFVNDTVFKDLSLEKEYDVLIFGNCDGEGLTLGGINTADKEYFKEYTEKTGEDIPEKYPFYPLRKKVKDLLLRYTGIYKIKYIPCSDSGCWDCQTRGVDLAIEINKAYLCLATRSRADKCMRKYMEVASCGTTILGNIPTDYRDMFEGRMVEITDFMSDEQLLKLIDEALKRKEEWSRKAKMFGRYFRERFGVENMDNAKEFISLAKKFLE
jgi:hypothetical protein